jgi:hypothetical protein
MTWEKRAVDMGEVQLRMGVQPIEELLAEREELVRQVADLRARHGSFGTYNDLRKIELAQVAQTIRAKLLRDGGKMTETAITDAAHSDPRYQEFVIEATQERAQWAILEGRIDAIDARINRGQVVARFITSEMHL